MLQNALIAGIKITEYWDLTLGEIKAIISAYNKQKDNEYHSNLIMNYELSRNIAYFVGCILNGKKIPEYDKLYPNKEEKPVSKEEQKQYISAYKEMFKVYSAEYNAVRKKKGVH